MKQESKVKKFTFSQEEREMLQNTDLGIINAEATINGLQVYKNMVLNSVYKRLGIDKDAPEGFSKSIKYNLRLGEIEYSEVPNNIKNPDMKIKSPLIVDKK